MAAQDSLSLFATKALLKQIKEAETKGGRSIIPSFCLRGEAAISILTGVDARSRKSEYGGHKIECYSVEADAPQANSSLIYETLRHFSVQPPAAKKGTWWGFVATPDGKDYTKSIFLFRQDNYNGRSHSTIPVKITLIGDYNQGLLHLINPLYLPQPTADRANPTWNTCTFKPKHLKFRVYSPTLLLIHLLLRRPEGAPTELEYMTHLIMLLMEKGFEPALKEREDEGTTLDQFSPSNCHKVLALLKPEILDQAETSVKNLESKFARVCDDTLQYREDLQLDGSDDALVMKDLLKSTFLAAEQVLREKQARAYPAYHPGPSTTYYQAPHPSIPNVYAYVPPPHVPLYAPHDPHYAQARPRPYPRSSPRYGVNNPSRTW